ncbi:MAG: hypothetical protein HYY18_01700 [Planctomycetes bacterium]|nr:hypothetical protein [Planctomycetota bacterium]
MNDRVKVFLLLALFAGAMAIGLRLLKGRDAEPAAGGAAAPDAAKPAEDARPPDAEPPPKAARKLRIPDPAQGALADPNAPPFPLAVYTSRREAELRKWRDAKFTLDFSATPLRDALAHILREYDLVANLDAAVGADASVTLKVSDLDGLNSLKVMAGMLQLAWVVTESGESWLVPKEKAALYEPELYRELTRLQAVAEEIAADRTPVAKTPADEKVVQVLSTCRVSIDFSDTPVFDAVAYLQELSQLNYVVEANVMKEAEKYRVTCKVVDRPLKEALSEVLSAQGLVFAVERGIVIVRTRDAQQALDAKSTSTTSARDARAKTENDFFSKRVTLPAEDLFIRDVAELISKATGVGYVIDPATWSRAANYGFDGQERTIREVADILGKGAPVTLAFREGKMWFLDRAAPK